MTSLWEILALGLLLGAKHALDPDHLVAVTTIVSEYRNPLRAVWVGVSWGLGHTTTLLLAGTTLLLLNLHLPERLALSFEFIVGIMLVVLGVQAFVMFRRRRVLADRHVHAVDDARLPGHSSEPPRAHEHHAHFHLPSFWRGIVRPSDGAPIASGEHQRLGSSNKPSFRLKSYVVGMAHGLAGSAAIMLLALASIRSTWSGAIYIAIFGLGTVVSMGLISIFISLPFSISSRLPRLNRGIQAVAGAVSIAFGLFLMYQIGIAQGLLLNT